VKLSVNFGITHINGIRENVGRNDVSAVSGIPVSVILAVKAFEEISGIVTVADYVAAIQVNPMSGDDDGRPDSCGRDRLPEK